MRSYSPVKLDAPLGVRFSPAELNNVVDLIVARADDVLVYQTCNLNHLRELQSNAEFREAYSDAHLITIDGWPVRFLLLLKGGGRHPIVTGADLFPRVLQKLQPAKHRPFFVSSDDNVGQRLVDIMAGYGFADESCGFFSPPFGFDSNAEESRKILSLLGEHRPTHIFFGVGAPKSEIWVHRNFKHLPPAHILCVGAALEFATGLKKRAPQLLRRTGLEWAHRLLSDRRRLSARYSADAAFFFKAICGLRLVQLRQSRQ